MPGRRSLRFLERGESVLPFGSVGVGTTHVASALGHLACRRGHSVLFAKTSRVLAELARGRADGSWEERLRRLARVDLPILTTNRSPKDWYELFPSKSYRPRRRPGQTPEFANGGATE